MAEFKALFSRLFDLGSYLRQQVGFQEVIYGSQVAFPGLPGVRKGGREPAIFLILSRFVSSNPPSLALFWFLGGGVSKGNFAAAIRLFSGLEFRQKPFFLGSLPFVFG